MRIRPLRIGRLWRLVPVLLLLCLCAPRASAQVPDAVVQRIVDLNVQVSELQFERDSHQIDTDTWAARSRTVKDEIRTLQRQLGMLPADQQRQATTQIENETRTRLATLEPEWRGKITAARQAENDARDQRKTPNPPARAPAPPPRPALAPRPGDGGTTPEDYQRDYKLAADLNAKLTEAGRHLSNKEIDNAAYQKTASEVFDGLRRLAEKWQRVGIKFGGPTAEPLPVSTPTPEPKAPGIAAYLVVVFVIGGVIYLVYRATQSKPEPAPARPRVSDVHGTAHFAPLRTMMPNEHHVDYGVFFGKSSDESTIKGPLEAQGAPVCSTPEHHTLIVARTRTGKGTRVIVPTLLKYQGSALVIDPKGENAAITALIRSSGLKQEVRILNPWSELADNEIFGFYRATYNPLDVLDRNDPNVVAIAQTLAATICPAPADGKDKFWQGSAANMLTAVLLWLAEYEPEHKTLGRAREIVSLTRKDLRDKFLIPMAASEAFSGAIKEMAAPFIDLAQETYSGVMSNLSEATRFLSDPQIKAATAKSSFSMSDLAMKKATVYVVIPPERMDTQKTWLRLVIASAMQSVKRVRAKERGTHRCLFLIDEFAALGRMEDLPRDIATMSGFGLDCALVVQGLDQLKDHYHEAAATILSNCAYKWFCNVGDLESAKYLSETLGKATVQTVSTSSSFTAGTPGQHGTPGSSTTSTSRGETGRSLLNPDEILNLGKSVAITMQPNGHPHLLRTIDYWNLPTAFVVLENIYPSLYWDPPLAYAPNPYVARQAEPAPVAPGTKVFVRAGS